MSAELEYTVRNDGVVEFQKSGNCYHVRIFPRRARIGLTLVHEESTVHVDKVDLGSAKERERFAEFVGGVEARHELVVLEGLVSRQRDDVDTHSGGQQDADSQATLLVALAEERGEFFHTPDQGPYATVAVGDHHETWHLRSRAFRSWLVRRFYRQEEKSPPSQAVADALNVLEGRALFDGETVDVHIRVAEHDGKIYVDLANDVWKVVEVTANGWSILAEAPVKFRRTRGVLALPTPVEGGSLDELRALINAGSDDNWVLLVSWLLRAFSSKGPYPELALHGEQGSAKTTTARMLRALVDPNTAALRSEPREVRDLMIAATNGWVVGYDNASRVPDWLSDALCRLSTGGGFGTRELYTNNEEKLFDATRPVMLNGIEELATRGDLLDRALILYLPAIPQERRQPEERIWHAFDEAAPRIFGALLTAVSHALRNRSSVHLAELPRMADFALWMAAAEPALGWPAGTFLRAFSANQEQANELPLSSSLLTDPLRELAEQGAWEGTATQLLHRLEEIASAELTKKKGWPRTPQALSNSLRRLAPNLRAVGIDLEFQRDRKQRSIRVGPTRQTLVTPVTAVTAERDPFADDDGDERDAPVRTFRGGANGQEVDPWA